MMFKKKVVVGVVSTILVVGGGFAAYYFWPNEDKPVVKKEEKEKEESSLKVYEEVKFNLGDEVPGVDAFVGSDVVLENVTLNLDEVEAKNLYFDAEGNEVKATQALKNKELKEGYSRKVVLAKIGEYKVVISDVTNGEEYVSKIVVVDEVKPVLELEEVSIKKGASYEIEDFVKMCSDNSEKDCDIAYSKEEMGEYKEPGEYEIEIIAKDDSGNEIKVSTKLVITGKKTVTGNKDEDEKDSGGNSSNKQEDVVDKDDESDKKEDDKNESVDEGDSTDREENSAGGGSSSSDSKEEESEKEEFNLTTMQMKPEAVSLVNSQAAKLEEVLKYVNEYRIAAGVEPLVLDENLNVGASVRAIEMGATGYFDHTRPNGTSCFTVYTELGITASVKGENIAAGYRTPREVVTAWYNSDGHRKNMLDARFKRLGVGIKSADMIYWVQLFAS